MSIVNSFHIMAKPSGSLCNLDCGYCFYLEKEKLYPNENEWRMSDRVLEEYTKQFIESQQTKQVTFTWQGGEPTLLGIEFYKKALDFQKKYSDGRTVSNSFQTNGILIDDDWARFLGENGFLVGLSIDGPADLHNKYRVTKGGQPSFEKVMKGLESLKKFGVDFNTLTCVQRENSSKALEVYNFLKKIGSQFLQFIPIVECQRKDADRSHLSLVSPDFDGDAEVTTWSVEPLQYGIFMQEIFDEWVRKDVGKIFVQMFDVCLGVWYGQPAALCLFRETCGAAMALEYNGDLYSCDHYVYPQNKLGNIIDQKLYQMANSDQQLDFGLTKKTSLPEQCQNCNVKFICRGGCPKHRFAKTPDGESGLNYLCKGYQHFFRHIDKAMRFMVNELNNERPPANVMTWMTQEG